MAILCSPSLAGLAGWSGSQYMKPFLGPPWPWDQSHLAVSLSVLRACWSAQESLRNAELGPCAGARLWVGQGSCRLDQLRQPRSLGLVAPG